jgi:hypothetical protein
MNHNSTEQWLARLSALAVSALLVVGCSSDSTGGGTTPVGGGLR